MNTKPILFSTEMVQAILADRKTQTRRIIKHDLGLLMDAKNVKPSITDEGLMVHFKVHDGHPRESFCGLKNPYGKIGDILWVRESFNFNPILQTAPIFKADSNIQKFIKWKPSIHMPKEACRLFLKITNVRVERLKDITEMDAIFEGCMQYDKNTDWMTALYGFELLWKKINGENSWNSNPWVWVIEFEKVEKPENF